jgi:hypothetical protein
MKHARIWLFVGILLIAGLAVFSAQGCAFRDFIKAKTPTGIQQTHGLAASLPLTQAERAYEAWLTDVQREGAYWRENIGRATETADLLSSMAMQQLGNLAPFLGPLAPAVFGLAGLMIRRPGDVSQRDKEKAYNKGMEVGRNGGTAA